MGPPPPPPPSAYTELDRSLPIVMLPVRIETRYFDVDILTVELRIRIFPSPAHVTTNRTSVDPAERDELVAYWTVRHRHGNDSVEATAAYDHLVAQFGEPRAQWLRRILTPAVSVNGALTFPDVPISSSDDALDPDEATEATALPSRFFVIGYRGDRRHFVLTGKNLPARLPVGAFGAEAETLWQTDFNAAEELGLAVRTRMIRFLIPPVSRLLVYGVREGADADSSATLLSELLERHSRDGGVTLLPAGTPTNHTPSSPVPPLPTATGEPPSHGSDGEHLASALGLDKAVFASAGGASRATNPFVESIHCALWPATIGYFLRDVMRPLFDAPALARAKLLFQEYVRPRGPWPALVLGSQPFGVLPVSSLTEWRKVDGTDDPLAKGLFNLRANRLEAASKVPRLSASADTSATLVDILSSSPVSTRWRGRSLETHHVIRRLFSTVNEERWQTTLDAMRTSAAGTLSPMGLGTNPRALDFIFNHETFGLGAPLVAPANVDRSAPLADNYILGMVSASVDDLRNNTVAGSNPRTLLYLLLRHSTLLAMTRISDNFQPQPLSDSEFVENTADTAWSRMRVPVRELGDRPLAEVLASPLPDHPALADYAEHQQCLTTLSGASVGQLESVTAEALDACSHRIDAWVTALATERLAAMRTTAPAGLHLGAYAWVDAPSVPQVVPRDNTPPQVDLDSEGFIHAPRLTLARTAAILRAAFLSRENQAAQAPLLVDLSSDRVRLARWLLNGVRNGANLAALLGVRVERWMIARGLGPAIADLRDRFSVVDGSGRTRIDGLALAEEWAARPPAEPLLRITRQLEALMDAAADLLLAEAVHQHATGNASRAQTALAALETGAALPDEFNVVRTEADSSTRIWRLILPLDEQAIDVWVAEILGDFSQLRATVHSETGASSLVSLADLGVTTREFIEYAKNDPAAPALVARFGAAPTDRVEFETQLQRTLIAANAIASLLRNSRPLETGDLGAVDVAPTPLAGIQKRSEKKQWLHDLGRMRPAIDALDTLESFLRGSRPSNPAHDLGLEFFDAGDNVTLVSIGPLDRASRLTGFLIDGWNEKTPGIEATTGVAFHYDAPRARSPQAILILVPPNPVVGWSAQAVEASLLDVAVASQIRMIRPADVHGPFLPALYFAENLGGHTVSTNFFEIATTTVVKEQ